MIKANWNNKDINIANTAEELNVGLDSFVFVDDNPVERAIVKEQLPQVTVPDLDEPEQYIKVLDRAGYFEVTRLTDEDRERVRMYQATAERNSEKKKYSNYGEFLLSLDMEAEIKEIDEENMQRVVQLINKSNQFNLTTKRFMESDIRRFMEDENYIVLYGRLRDKFGDNGIVSVLIARKEKKDVHIDLFLMSCRVLKRGMEDAMMDELFHLLNPEENKYVYGYYFKTKKNTLVENLYQEMGFHTVEATDDSKIYIISEVDYIKKNKNIRVI